MQCKDRYRVGEFQEGLTPSSRAKMLIFSRPLCRCMASMSQGIVMKEAVFNCSGVATIDIRYRPASRTFLGTSLDFRIQILKFYLSKGSILGRPYQRRNTNLEYQGNQIARENRPYKSEPRSLHITPFRMPVCPCAQRYRPKECKKNVLENSR